MTGCCSKSIPKDESPPSLSTTPNSATPTTPACVTPSPAVWTGADMNNAYGWYGEQGAKEAKSRPSQRRRLIVDRKSFGFYHNLMGFPKVTVGEISGYALGGGLEMVLMTDISVIARDTKIGMPATRFLGPALGSLHMFFHRLGAGLVRRLLLLGGMM